MIGIVVAAHGRLAQALVETAREVVHGELRVASVPIEAGDDTASFQERLRGAIQQLQNEAGVMVLTDMFGGTPANVGMTMHEQQKTEVLTGVNLPMVIKALQLASRGLDLEAAARQVKAAGQSSIAIASEVLATPREEPS
jgi:mannose PTS system EIIA component